MSEEVTKHKRGECRVLTPPGITVAQACWHDSPKRERVGISSCGMCQSWHRPWGGHQGTTSPMRLASQITQEMWGQQSPCWGQTDRARSCGLLGPRDAMWGLGASSYTVPALPPPNLPPWVSLGEQEWTSDVDPQVNQRIG